MPYKKNVEKNEFLVLAYVIILGMIAEAISALSMISGAGIAYAIGSICILSLFGLVVVYGVKIIALREWSRGFWYAGVLHFLRTGMFLVYFLPMVVIGKGTFIVLIGILLVLSDLCFGIGMKSVVQEESRGLKWAWTIWICVGVIVGIGVTYICGVCGTKILSERFIENVVFGHREELKLIMYAFLAYWVFRVVQAVLTLITAKVME